MNVQERPRVSVIIPVRNRPGFIREALDSVVRQTYRNLEIIVIDDGSTDATPSVLEIYGSIIRVITTAPAGPSAARNRGIEQARGEFIALLDSDDIWLPRKLEIQVEFFKRHPDTVICQTEELWIRNGVRVNPGHKHRKHSGWIFTQCLPLCIISPSAVMMRAGLLDRVGLFDEEMPACEDYDLWLRITSRHAVHLIDEPLIIKRGGHADQQSRVIEHLDRWRIRALCKILESGRLSLVQHAQALSELRRKCRIYGNGCLKRNKTEEGLCCLALPDRYAAPPGIRPYEPLGCS